VTCALPLFGDRRRGSPPGSGDCSLKGGSWGERNQGKEATSLFSPLEAILREEKNAMLVHLGEETDKRGTPSQEVKRKRR